MSSPACSHALRSAGRIRNTPEWKIFEVPKYPSTEIPKYGLAEILRIGLVKGGAGRVGFAIPENERIVNVATRMWGFQVESLLSLLMGA